VIKLIFHNECECVVDYEILASAIEKRCREKQKKTRQEYRIVMHNNYPTIHIAHDHVYVHNLIGEYKYGSIPKGYVIHHNDNNKKNNDVSNLVLLTNIEHALIHGEQRKGIDLRSEDGKWKGLNAARKKRYRSDVRREDILPLIEKGMSFENISKILNCGTNTVRRRMIINWEEEDDER
jgi:hypothetical protein